MDASIIVSLITGAVTIATVIINSRASNKEFTYKLETQQAVFETKLENLITEVGKQSARIDQHNHLNERLIAVEVKLKSIEGKDDE